MLRTATSLQPRLAIVLGSAFGQVAEVVTDAKRVGFTDLPGCAKPGVDGHAGQFIIGRLGGAEVLLQAGRLHYYEGHSMAKVTYPIRVMAAFGIEKLLLTNAAGGIAEDLAVGDFMRITDHINLMGDNPLRGIATATLPRFVDMSTSAWPSRRQLWHRVEKRSVRGGARPKLRDASRDPGLRVAGCRRHCDEHRPGDNRCPPARPRRRRPIMHHQRRRRLGPVCNQPRGGAPTILPIRQSGSKTADELLRVRSNEWDADERR